MPGALRKRSLPYLLLLPGLGWLLLFFAIPLVYMFLESLKSGSPFGGGFHLTWEFSNYSDALKDYDEQFIRSFEYAGLATLIALLIGYPLAYVIAFRGGRWRNAMLLLVIVPFFVTYLIRTLSWETILSDSGFVVSTLQTIGLVSDSGRLLDTTVSVIAGITYNYLPFMILPLYANLEKMDLSLLEAATDLGCKPLKAFFVITVPLSFPGIVAGSMLVFIPAVGEYVIPELLGGPSSLMIGRVLVNEFFSNRDWPTASAVAVAILIALVGPLMIYQKYQDKELEKET